MNDHTIPTIVHAAARSLRLDHGRLVADGPTDLILVIYA